MRDWIDDLEDTVCRSGHQHTALRLHDAHLINAKAATFWAATVRAVTSYCHKLKMKFPDNPEYHCELIGLSDGGLRFFSGGPLPHTGIDARLNAPGQCIEIQEGTRQDRQSWQVEDGDFYEAEITVGPQEQLRVSFKGKTHESASSFAEHLVRCICRIPVPKTFS